jgi:hypothetical protein
MNCSQQKEKDMSKKFKPFTTLTVPQVTFLEGHLRGTERKMSEAQAKATYGIMNLRARISDLRAAGLKIRVTKNTEGRATYAVSARDVHGSRAQVFAI